MAGANRISRRRPRVGNSAHSPLPPSAMPQNLIRLAQELEVTMTSPLILSLVDGPEPLIREFNRCSACSRLLAIVSPT